MNETSAVTGLRGQLPDFSGRTLLKVGGSLLDRPNLAEGLEASLREISSPLLLAGGGAAADLVRRWDEHFAFGEEAAHRMALRSLQLTASLLETRLPGSECCRVPQLIEGLRERGLVPVIDPVSWLWQIEPAARYCLPHTWEATSDTIALWLCAELRIPRLVLLKSIDRPNGESWERMADTGLVDEAFPRLWRQLDSQPEVVWQNLRAG